MSVVILSLLLSGPAASVGGSPTDPVRALYKEVVQRHPLGLWVDEDKAAIWPLLSTRLTTALDALQACENEYFEGNRKLFTDEEASQLKPSIGWMEYGLFSGSSERTSPAEVDITRVVPSKTGAFRVYVRFTYRDTFYGRPQDSYQWSGMVLVVPERGHYVVDDFRGIDSESGKLDRGLPKLFSECRGAHWAGRSRF
jgi:hypothetical protein